MSAIPGITLDAILDDLADRVAERLEERMQHRPSVCELLTVKETAERIGRTAGATRALITRRELPCVRRGRRVHVRVRDLQSWIDKDAT